MLRDHSQSLLPLSSLTTSILVLFVWTHTITSIQSYQPNNPYSPHENNQSNNRMKAWTCHGRSQRELVDHLGQAGIIKSAAVQQVMELVDRQFYTGDKLPDGAGPYMDRPLSIAQGQTISAPHMHAYVLEELLHAVSRNAIAEQRPVKVLDVGCGSGYLTACFGRWFQPKNKSSADPLNSPILPFSGSVYGLDIHPELVQFTISNLQKNDADLLQTGLISLKHGNGWIGWPEESPFDAIHVGAAADRFPVQLAMQLSVHGVLVVPVGPHGNDQTLLKVERILPSSGTDFAWNDFQVTELLGVRYVPLIQRPDD